MSNDLCRFADNGRTWAVYALLLCLLAGLFFGNLRHHLLDTHDLETFRDNERIEEDWTFFFSAEKAQASGRPLAELVKYGVYRIWGHDPAAFHLLVVALHVLTSLLLAVVCRRMAGDLELAFLSGLLFLVNVAHFQAVHHISALDYPLALSCSLLGLHAYPGFIDTGSRRAWGRFAIFLFLGLMTHLSIFALAPFVLYYAWRRGSHWRELAFQGMLLGLLLLGTAAGLLLLAGRETSTWVSIGEYRAQELWTLIAGMGRVLLWFASRLLTTAHWLPLPVYAQQEWELYLAAILLAGLGALIWKRVETAWVWAGWVLLWLLPFMLLTEKTVLELPAGPSRYLYAASAGSSVLLAWLLQGALRRLGKTGNYLFPLVLLILLFTSYRGLARVEAISLYTSGRCYIAGGQADLGIAHPRRAIDQGAGAIPLEETYFRLACVLPLAGEDPQPTLREGLDRFPDSIWLGSFMAVVELGVDNPSARGKGRERLHLAREKALAAGEEESFSANLAGFSYNLGRKYLNQGECERAIQAFEQAREFFPGRDKYRTAMAAAYGRLGLQRDHRGDIDGVAEAFRQVLEIDPGNVEAQEHLARLLPGEGR